MARSRIASPTVEVVISVIAVDTEEATVTEEEAASATGGEATARAVRTVEVEIGTAMADFADTSINILFRPTEIYCCYTTDCMGRDT